jgi:hypothetical protein
VGLPDGRLLALLEAPPPPPFVVELLFVELLLHEVSAKSAATATAAIPRRDFTEISWIGWMMEPAPVVPGLGVMWLVSESSGNLTATPVEIM